jgi:hypothetical protein
MMAGHKSRYSAFVQFTNIKLAQQAIDEFDEFDDAMMGLLMVDGVRMCIIPCETKRGE